MSIATSEVNQWIPVLAVVIGALISFCSSFFIIKLTKGKEAELAKNERDRRRIERVYELLVQLRSQNLEHMKETVLYLQYPENKSFKKQQLEDFPPIYELEMLVDLYIQKLINIKNEYISEVQQFYSVCSELRKVSKPDSIDKLIASSKGIENLFLKFKGKLNKLVVS